MLGVGGLSLYRGMGASVEIRVLTEKAGSRCDSLNLLFTLAALEERGGNTTDSNYLLNLLTPLGISASI